MKFNLFNGLATCLVTSLCLSIAPTALSQSVEQLRGEEVQHLTCIKDAQGLMCQPDARDTKATKSEVNTRTAMTESQHAATIATTPQILSSDQLGAISNLLLGFLYFMLPVGLGLSLFLHDKQAVERSTMLQTQIELLERVWQQNPHHPQH